MLIVLWGIVPLTIISSRIVATGQSELRLSTALVAAEQADAEADGAVQDAIFRLAAGQWPIKAALYRWALPDAQAVIRIEPEKDKINPNTASVLALQYLMEATGIRSATAAIVARNIVLWRTPPALMTTEEQADLARLATSSTMEAVAGHYFTSLDGLLSLPGMTPALLDRLRAHLSLYQPDIPDTGASDPLVMHALLRATKVDGIRLPSASSPADIRSSDHIAVTVAVMIVRKADGREAAARVATVQLNPDKGIVTVLDWRRVPLSRAAERVVKGR
ncbi:General secretion pathway protein K [Granulibacter bethesdensis]|uniref:General secretion pathway protein K n=1 Tax=Granulibacter bethesdensis TaxID=364410 RepID=A0AAN0REW7_9PROT|nr:type II secretion system protein GspK [Granulibacter bethesdensis]AHJ63669.1 General secretion pathway protein K [Granulibacter bethesdensis]